MGKHTYVFRATVVIDTPTSQETIEAYGVTESEAAERALDLVRKQDFVRTSELDHVDSAPCHECEASVPVPDMKLEFGNPYCEPCWQDAWGD